MPRSVDLLVGRAAASHITGDVQRLTRAGGLNGFMLLVFAFVLCTHLLLSLLCLVIQTCQVQLRKLFVYRAEDGVWKQKLLILRGLLAD